MRDKVKTIAIVITASITILLATGLIIWRKPAAIKYHKWRISALLNRKPEFDSVSGLSFFGEDWYRALEKHRDKLIELGYLQRKEFQLTTIKTPSLRFRRLWEELGARFPDNPYTVGLGYESDSPAIIVVWDEPDKLGEWDKLISAHDAPPTSIVRLEAHKDLQHVLPFVGRWASPDGTVCYIISKDSDGSLKIQTPPNEAWRTVFRNARLEDKTITFDQFNYADPDEDYESPIDTAGEHVFSGVRCETVLGLNPYDSNELFENVTAVSKYGTYSDPNKSVLKKLK
jgi:hypothetical protein